MFIIVAINTEVLPVRTVRRIIQMVSIFVVHRQEMPCLFIEFPSALGTDKAVYLERALSIITPWLGTFF